jgi:hypothetical protein
VHEFASAIRLGRIYSQQKEQTMNTQDTSKPEQYKQAAQETAGTAVSEVKHAAGAVASEAKHTLAEVASQTKEQAAELAGQAKQQAGEKIEEQKSQAAERLEGVASALRDTGRKLEEQDEALFAQYADSLADQVEKASTYLQTMSISDIAREVQSFAQRKPEMFLLTSLAAGFLVGRFLGSSSEKAASGDNAYYSGGNGGSYNTGGYASAPRTWPDEYNDTVSEQPWRGQYSDTAADRPWREEPYDTVSSQGSASDYSVSG